MTPGVVFDIGAQFGDASIPEESQSTIFSGRRLQDIPDYRAAIQAWFKALRVGGRLLITVPHAFLDDRGLSLPSPPTSGRRRLYTPGLLLAEVEEALAPNTYRVRWLGDDDAGYDYQLDPEIEPVGSADILLVLERIAEPAWSVVESGTAPIIRPDYSFEPERTRVEFVAFPPRRRIVILKLDHLGDFIMGIPALRHARTAFADSHLTLVVGSWNLDVAREMNLADVVIPFDVFPRNSSEEEVDVPGKTALFQQVVTGAYDLAIDLRTDPDTRFLLKVIRAGVRAGVGTRARFPFLDIFLPVDQTRNEPETAKDERLNHHMFASQSGVGRGEHRLTFRAEAVTRDCAIVWGPYLPLRPGRYIYEPFIELDPLGAGLLSVDVALESQWVAQTTLPAPERVRLRFSVEKPGARFESRIWALDGHAAIDFSFYGGRLSREGAASVLHQSEYLALLIDLIIMRMDRLGLLSEAGA